jgi:type VI secretion system secreted protein VgrG
MPFYAFKFSSVEHILMAKLLKKTTIHINGKEVKQFYKFSLQQAIFGHHHFQLICPSEALDGPDGRLFANTNEYIGTTFLLKLDGDESAQSSLQFAGIVTQIESSRHNGHAGSIIICGFSPTLIMDNGLHCNSWENETLKSIASNVCEHFPANLLNTNIKPTNNNTFEYTVQYKETAWQFISRLAATYGEWLMYDGKNLVLGIPKSQTAELIFGANLSNFNMSLNAMPQNFLQVSYDHVNDKMLKANPDNIAQLAGLDARGKKLFDQSNTLYPNMPKYFNSQFFQVEKELNDHSNTRAAAQSSNLVRFNGSSSHLGVQLGNKINVSNNYGSFTVIEVNHFVDGQGQYHNEFISIPASIKVPPVTQYVEPNCETQSAIVTDNFDPEGLGRIRVRFHWMKPNKKTPWLRMIMPHAGLNKGSFFIPEKEEAVVVSFENNCPTKAFVAGAIYNGKQSTSFSNEGNDIKMIQTRSGTKIKMNDAEGSIFIEDPSGNTWLMDGKGNISVNAPKNFTVVAGDNITMNAGKEIFVNAGKSIAQTANVNITSYAGKDIMQTASGDIHETSDKRMEMVEKDFKRQAHFSDEVAGEAKLFSFLENMTMQSGSTVLFNSAEKSKLF